jgi:hypothetical protein
MQDMSMVHDKRYTVVSLQQRVDDVYSTMLGTHTDFFEALPRVSAFIRHRYYDVKSQPKTLW